MRIAIMQGRLLPPVDGRFQAFPADRWRDEFPLAAAAGLAGIEWIFDTLGETRNPIATDAGISELRQCSTRHGVAVESLCADWFMDRPLLHATGPERAERMRKLEWLIRRAAAAGIRHLVLPFVDASAIRDGEDVTRLVAMLHATLPVAEACGVELHLETALAPGDFAAMLVRIPHPLVRVNYDCGNSASCGHRPSEEFTAYGGRIGSVHVKDRVRDGGTVPLGDGNVDFAAVREGLREVGYAGLFTLQVARADEGDELDWARHNRMLTEELFT